MNESDYSILREGETIDMLLKTSDELAFEQAACDSWQVNSTPVDNQPAHHGEAELRAKMTDAQWLLWLGV